MRGTLPSRSTRRRIFDPRSIPGCAGWFDANDLGFLLADAAVIDTWRDKSGGGRDLTQSGSARPTLKLDIRNGLSVVRFDGNNDYMSTTAAGLGDLVSGSDLPATILVALASSNFASAQTIAGFFDAAAANGSLRIAANVTPKWVTFKIDDAGTNVNSNSTVAADSAFHVVSMASAGTTVDMIVDGVSQFSGTNQDVGATTTTRFALGARANLSPGAFFFGDIGEVLVYNRYLDAAEQMRAQRYLGRRWGVFL